jgi:hypothetical protein
MRRIPTIGITKVPVIGYVSWNLVPIAGNTTQDAMPTAEPPSAHHPKADRGKTALREVGGLVVLLGMMLDFAT